MTYKNKSIEEISDAFLEGEIELPASKPSPKSYGKAGPLENSDAELMQRIRKEIGATQINATKVNDTINITADATEYYHIDLGDLVEWERGKMSTRELIRVGYKYPFGW